MTNTHRTLGTFLASALVCLAASGFAAAIQDDSSRSLNQTSTTGSTIKKDAATAVQSWPTSTRKAAQAMIEKYGQPDAVTDRMLVWNDKDPWTKVVVYRDAINQGSFLTHDAFLENTVAYKVPLDKVADLIRFDSSLVIDETRGTLASSCDTEGCNYLALNLANDIATGKRDVASAKDFFKNTMTKSLSGKSSPEMEKLMFPTSGSSSSPSSSPSASPSSSGSMDENNQVPSSTPQSEPSSPIREGE
jgi:hypothetical protein